MKLYNTLTREKQQFQPQQQYVTMYSCGPTVYNYAHIGNLRTYIFMDLLRRGLKHNGYKIKGVLNITDVGHLLSDADEGEDKMQIASRREKKSPYEIADYYTAAFFKDLHRLNIDCPEIVAKATEHIEEMCDFVAKLVEKGYGYQTSDGIYFDIDKFKDYGKLSGIDLAEQKAGARVDVNDEKHNPYDFALWKKAEPQHIMQWQSQWGMGYPGWHIECSAMSKKYLGDTFDIHTGGVDHIPIHHENEIAQSEALTGKTSARFWMHGEFMQVDGGKMSKSLGNVYTVEDLIARGYSPMDFRYFCLNAHYRKKLNFTFEAMDAAKTAFDKLSRQLLSHKSAPTKTEQAILDRYKADFDAAINDDINVPMALGILWTMLKEAKSNDIYNMALYMDEVFGLRLKDITPATDSIAITLPPEITQLLEQRKAARANKDFKQSDIIRDKLAELGYKVKDTKEGQVIEKE